MQGASLGTYGGFGETVQETTPEASLLTADAAARLHFRCESSTDEVSLFSLATNVGGTYQELISCLHKERTQVEHYGPLRSCRVPPLYSQKLNIFVLLACFAADTQRSASNIISAHLIACV